MVETHDGKHVIRLDCNGAAVEVRSPSSADVGGPVTVALRPERLAVVPAGEEIEGVNRLDTEVLSSSYVGSHYEYDVRLGDQVVQVESNRPGLTGSVQLVFNPEHALLYTEKVELPEDQRELLTVHS
jgi:iron(III) transport system ATP-binding protein